MKRTVIVAALVLVLALMGAPAFAQMGEGSVLPAQEDTEVMPTGTSRSSSAYQAGSGPVLADTGLGLGDGTLLAAGLLALGGMALVAGRRRSTRG
jgi:hypothetical protein